MNITMEELIRIIREELTSFAGGKGHLAYPKGKLPVSDEPPTKGFPQADEVEFAVGKKYKYKVSPKAPTEDPEEETDYDVESV